jgi:lysophospholipase L1-like esterase
MSHRKAFAALLLLFSGAACAQTSVNGVSGQAVGSTYIGLVTTRNEMQESLNASATWSMGRVMQYARRPIAANTMKIVFGNFYVPSTNVETSPGTGTYKVSVEYPLGTFAACTFAGSATGSVTGIGLATTDACGPAIPDGARFWIRVLYTNPAGMIYTAGGSNHYGLQFQTAQGDAFIFGTGTAADYTAGTAVGSGSPVFSAATTALMAPVAVLAPTNQATVVLVGDSRCVGNGDTVSDQSADQGELARPVGMQFAYSKLCAQSGTAAAFVTSTNSAERQILINSVIHPTLVIDSYGVNDIFTGGAVATLITNLNAIAALWPAIETWGTTIPPETTTASLTLTAAGTASGGVTAYVGTFPNCGTNACVGAFFTVAGFTNGANNGTWAATASTTTALTLANTAGVAETHAGTATDNWGTTVNQASVNAGQTSNLYSFNYVFAMRGSIFNERRVLDINQIFDPGNTGLWPVSALNGQTVNAQRTNYATTDGVHESYQGNQLIANRLVNAFAALARVNP